MAGFLGNILRGGRSKAFNGMMGGLAGLSDIGNNPYKFYNQSQWAGNGLAKGGIGYAKNQDYFNPYDMGEALGSMMANRNGDDEDNLGPGGERVKTSDWFSKFKPRQFGLDLAGKMSNANGWLGNMGDKLFKRQTSGLVGDFPQNDWTVA